jgi:DNA-binding HxlR family transcriptional regulator
VRRFDEFLATGISGNILTTRLNNLIDHGILVKRPVDGRSADYLLTDKGLDLQPILLSFTHWGDKHMPHPRGPRLTFVEKSTGRPIREMSACSDNGRLLQARDIKAVPGPGMKSKE